MEVTLRLLVAALFVVSLAGQALGNCASSGWGSKGNYTYIFPPVKVNLTGGKTVSVSIPYTVPDGCQMVGMEAAFCGASSVTFQSDLTVLIKLDENISFYSKVGVLNAIAHCRTQVGVAPRP